MGMADGVGHQLAGEQRGLVGQFAAPPAAQGRGDQATSGAGAFRFSIEPGGHPPVLHAGERQVRFDDRAPTLSGGRLTVRVGRCMAVAAAPCAHDEDDEDGRGQPQKLAYVKRRAG